ncbi:hypothetical protein Tsp_06752, partial [Trichinella spiralis]|uniref:hypothetical protein n=1 Tax=Trichinella spiralis TaxID=6334 RepID=UPI0001EFC3E2
IEQCISLVHITLRHRLDIIFSKKFQYAKTGFQRCAMQMTITTKVPYRQYEAYGKVKTLSTRSETLTARSRTIKEKSARKTLFSATRTISDFYANRGGDRCAANEQWRFQCDDGRGIAIKTALNRRIEEGRERPEDEDHEYYFNEFEWLSAFERFHVPCLVELSLGFICGKRNG